MEPTNKKKYRRMCSADTEKVDKNVRWIGGYRVRVENK